MKITYFARDGKYDGVKRRFWASWSYMYLKAWKRIYICTPLGAINIYY